MTDWLFKVQIAMGVLYNNFEKLSNLKLQYGTMRHLQPASSWHFMRRVYFKPALPLPDNSVILADL